MDLTPFWSMYNWKMKIKKYYLNYDIGNVRFAINTLTPPRIKILNNFGKYAGFLILGFFFA